RFSSNRRSAMKSYSSARRARPLSGHPDKRPQTSSPFLEGAYAASTSEGECLQSWSSTRSRGDYRLREESESSCELFRECIDVYRAGSLRTRDRSSICPSQPCPWSLSSASEAAALNRPGSALRCTAPERRRSCPARNLRADRAPLPPEWCTESH